MAAVCAFGSCSRMIPLWAAFSRSVSSFNSWLGVIGSQSLAQRSAPNTAIPRDCIGGNAVVDFLSGLACRDLHQAAVQPGVMSDGVALGRNPSHQGRMFRG